MKTIIRSKYQTEMKQRKQSLNLMHKLCCQSVGNHEKFSRYFFIADAAYNVFCRIHLDYCKALDEGRVIGK